MQKYFLNPFKFVHMTVIFSILYLCSMSACGRGNLVEILNPKEDIDYFFCGRYRGWDKYPGRPHTMSRFRGFYGSSNSHYGCPETWLLTLVIHQQLVSANILLDVILLRYKMINILNNNSS